MGSLRFCILDIEPSTLTMADLLTQFSRILGFLSLLIICDFGPVFLQFFLKMLLLQAHERQLFCILLSLLFDVLTSSKFITTALLIPYWHSSRNWLKPCKVEGRVIQVCHFLYAKYNKSTGCSGPVLHWNSTVLQLRNKEAQEECLSQKRWETACTAHLI